MRRAYIGGLHKVLILVGGLLPYRRVTIACIMPSLSGVRSQSREARLESVREI